ncbi:MAG: (E)-4-hydroxy-3-methylbut-2-enyl-diphosphate synthase [Chlamydiales bacterium]
MKYCEKIYQTKRWKTREVMVGNVGVGGDNPIRIQSMTTSDTRDVEATVDQIIKLVDHGCEIARITVQGKKEAEACEDIKNLLIQKGYTIPLVADIHFYPPAAMHVADFVDKVRINPGNYVDKRALFKVIEYDENTYAKELEKIEEKFTPLVEKCKRLKRAMRIGTNHGSLSDRIMNRYGDTPAGMVESALEFARVCRQHDFHDIIFSMKASNTQVMIQAYRLLVAEMIKLGWDYPLHLGVTEAGEGEDGRVKSAIGIGSLLLDGIGETIRVSLTEDPWYEIDPCKRLIQFTNEYTGIAPFQETTRKIKTYEKRVVVVPDALHRDGSVVLSCTKREMEDPDFYTNIGCKMQLGQLIKEAGTVDAVLVEDGGDEKLKKAGIAMLTHPFTVSEESREWKRILEESPEMIFFRPKAHYIHNSRRFFEWIKMHSLQTPVILQFQYDCGEKDVVIRAAAEYGSLFCDGLGEGICLEANLPLAKRLSIGFSILQGARMRSSRTEFISCPSCGRTLFDLQSVAARIREKTAHLPGVKIAIMGCIVNGPGEMADADFGYVGSKPGKIDLYVGKIRVTADIDMKEADERLIELIKEHGRWVEPGEIKISVV